MNIKNNKSKEQNNLHSSHNKGSSKLGRLIFQLQRLERNPRIFGSAGPLTPSEIHTIDAIGCGEGILMSQLAARLGVTKGAITQIIDRLEDKELVMRSPHPDDSRSTLLSLKEKGLNAYQAHLEVHEAFYQHLRSQLGQQEIEIFEKVLDKLSIILES